MTRKTVFSDEERDWMEDYMDEYRENSTERNLNDWFLFLTPLWFLAFPESPTPEELASCGGNANEAAMHPDCVQRRSERMEVRNWFGNNSRVRPSGPAVPGLARPARSCILKPARKPKKPQLYQAWMRVAMADKDLKTTFDEAWKKAKGEGWSKKQSLKFQRQFADEHMPHSDPITMAAVHAYRDHGYLLKDESLISFDDDKEETRYRLASAKQEAINNLPFTLTRMLDSWALETGWHFSIIAGGPLPSLGGKLRTLYYGSGVDRAGHRFATSNAKFREEWEGSFSSFCERSWTKEQCAQLDIRSAEDRDSSEDAEASSSSSCASVAATDEPQPACIAATVEPQPAPVTATVEPPPAPVVATVEPQPAPIPATVEPPPAPVPATVEPPPAPVPTSVESQPIPVPAAVESQPVPVPAAVESQPVPVPATVEPQPAPITATIEPQPAPVAGFIQDATGAIARPGLAAREVLQPMNIDMTYMDPAAFQYPNTLNFGTVDPTVFSAFDSNYGAMDPMFYGSSAYPQDFSYMNALLDLPSIPEHPSGAVAALHSPVPPASVALLPPVPPASVALLPPAALGSAHLSPVSTSLSESSATVPTTCQPISSDVTGKAATANEPDVRSCAEILPPPTTAADPSPTLPPPTTAADPSPTLPLEKARVTSSNSNRPVSVRVSTRTPKIKINGANGFVVDFSLSTAKLVKHIRASPDLPDYFVDTVAFVADSVTRADFHAMLRAFILFESKGRFDSRKGSTTSAMRPSMTTKWMSTKRTEYTVVSANPVADAQAWCGWYTAIQPDWRRKDAMPHSRELPIDQAPDFPEIKTGRNGVVVVLLTLVWIFLGASAQGDSDVCSKVFEAVDDMTWMLTTAMKGRGDTETVSRPRKRAAKPNDENLQPAKKMRRTRA
ncbi:hypothetical protein PUNSTDRAFT_136331 [Punctularia strigosozonata HHB-11173 SS5]|uniref:uncharacterized protein n=1 Tax=Punctularia strigosozonata (strain HHB-11173) TaxID=741275 RepID=UPI00044184D4|nr:uncharacterized protein PUNSTDRAFT_136331 [Punctularia strigosozonata HHB-11173 SS5]EIN06471.1 hypothetical protein PUNSTDRAFT_136331 [Punctularia strigosozonata HHB-11173 SS5]